MLRLPTTVLGLLSLLLSLIFYLASTDIPKNLSPQGCRMSWMSPSYILQSEFNSSWSPLAERYSLWLYREVGWEGTPANGMPVLFIPGNAGSSHQVRSIASSATRQFYESPYVVSQAFAGKNAKPLDFYAVEFNEDLSAFHGPTLDSQISYSSRAIAYILAHYPACTQMIIIGHSMGGIVGVSLLPSANISAVITMSTPHTLPPARFDSRIEKIYTRNMDILATDPTPILSICGGATDMTIPSEACILPSVAENENNTEVIFRRTVFTSALEGSWTGVGHREMVWCHQVRWRVARAALELGISSSSGARGNTLDKWLRDGNRLPSTTLSQDHLSLQDPASFTTIPMDKHLELKTPFGSHTYVLRPDPLSSSTPSKFVLYVARGSIPPVAPQNPSSLRVSVHICRRQLFSSDSQPSCTSLIPTGLKLIPNPVPGTSFPVPDEGSDESEGVVVFEADVLTLPSDDTWVAVHIDGASGDGWIVGGFAASPEIITNDASALSSFVSGVSIRFPARQDVSLWSQIHIPNVLSNALVVYRITPISDTSSNSDAESTCAAAFLLPLLMHSSYPSETHYYPLKHDPPHPLFLHSHSSAPYIPGVRPTQMRGLNLTLYSSASSECTVGFDVYVDWWSTLGTLGSRYLMTILTWAVGIVALILLESWVPSDHKVSVPDMQHSLSKFISNRLLKLMLGSYIVACLPLPSKYYLGNRGEFLLAPIAPLLLLIVTGLVSISWWILLLLMWPIGRIGILFPNANSNGLGRGGAVSMGLIFLVIFLFVPWQVAFLGCWIIHLYTCATSHSGLTHADSSAAIPLINRSQSEDEDATDASNTSHMSTVDANKFDVNDRNRNMLVLLLMTWLLPLVAPVLAVWVRTLITAGFTTPFDGDHNFLNVAPFLLLVDSVSSRRTKEVVDSLRGSRAVHGSFVSLAVVSFFLGPRTAFRVLDVANIAVAFIVLTRSQVLSTIF